MTQQFKTLTLSAVLLALAATADAQVTFGIHIGPPPTERAYRVPARPGPDYVWVEGYQYPSAGRYKWHDGYWTRPPYPGADWVAPYYSDGQYYAGRWEGDRGGVMHDHRWDRKRTRDQDHRGDDDRGGRGNDDRNRGNDGRR